VTTCRGAEEQGGRRGNGDGAASAAAEHEHEWLSYSPSLTAPADTTPPLQLHIARTWQVVYTDASLQLERRPWRLRHTGRGQIAATGTDIADMKAVLQCAFEEEKGGRGGGEGTGAEGCRPPLEALAYETLPVFAPATLALAPATPAAEAKLKAEAETEAGRNVDFVLTFSRT